MLGSQIPEMGARGMSVEAAGIEWRESEEQKTKDETDVEEKKKSTTETKKIKKPYHRSRASPACSCAARSRICGNPARGRGGRRRRWRWRRWRGPCRRFLFCRVFFFKGEPARERKNRIKPNPSFLLRLLLDIIIAAHLGSTQLRKK